MTVNIFIAALIGLLAVVVLGSSAVGVVMAVIWMYSRGKYVLGTLALLVWLYIVFLAVIFFDPKNPIWK